jgi:hypothetical protein
LWLPLAAVGFVPVVFAGFALETEPAGFFEWAVALSMQTFPMACVACAVVGWAFLGVLQLWTPKPETVLRTRGTPLLLPAVPLVFWGTGWKGVWFPG